MNAETSRSSSLRSTLRNLDCSTKKLHAVCTFFRGKTLEQATMLGEMIMKQRARLPEKGQKRFIRQQWSYPVKPIKGLLSIIKSLKHHPFFDKNQTYAIHRLSYDQNPIIHRIFARAQGRSSSKNRRRFTVHLEVVPYIRKQNTPKQRTAQTYTDSSSTETFRSSSSETINEVR